MAMQLKSTAARAIVPVVGGIALIAALGGLLWLVAAYTASNAEVTSDRLAPPEWTVGGVENLSAVIAEGGPLLFRQPGVDDSERAIVIDHSGDDPTVGWRVYAAHPADRDSTCAVEIDRARREMTDCDGRVVTVDDLALPDASTVPRVDDQTVLVIDFRYGADTGS